jgi:hypothetical protein
LTYPAGPCWLVQLYANGRVLPLGDGVLSRMFPCVPTDAEVDAVVQAGRATDLHPDEVKVWRSRPCQDPGGEPTLIAHRRLDMEVPP